MGEEATNVKGLLDISSKSRQENESGGLGGEGGQRRQGKCDLGKVILGHQGTHQTIVWYGALTLLYIRYLDRIVE